MMQTQFEESFTADFSENTWTFLMDKNYKIKSGEFAIVPLEKYEALILAAKGIRNSMSAHPDYEPNSEFYDMVSRIDDSLLNL